MTRDVPVFVKMWHHFKIVFWKLPQFHTSNFHKVVRQRTEGMVGSIIWMLLEIYLAFQQWKNFKNPLRIDKIIAISLVYYFFRTQCKYKCKKRGYELTANDTSETVKITERLPCRQAHRQNMLPSNITFNIKFKFYNPKRHILAWFHVFWAIARKNPPTGLTCGQVKEKRCTMNEWRKERRRERTNTHINTQTNK